jgi:hypothetical protein
MATPWIKMRTDLAEDPAVYGIASATKLTRAAVVGSLHILWSWADNHTTDGYLPAITPTHIDAKVGKRGFARAMADWDWLEITPDGITFPNFNRHNGESAKKRLLDTDRKRTDRNRTESEPCPKINRTNSGQTSAHEPDKSVTREEKRRIQQQQPRRILNPTSDFPILATEFPAVDLHAEHEKARAYVRLKRGPKAEVEYEFFRDTWLPQSPAQSRGDSLYATEPCLRAQWLPYLADSIYGPGRSDEAKAAAWQTLPPEARAYIRQQLATAKTT